MAEPSPKWASQGVRPIAAREDHVVDAVAAQQVDLVRHERPVDQRHHRLGARVGERAQARARAAHEQHGLRHAGPTPTWAGIRPMPSKV